MTDLRPRRSLLAAVFCLCSAGAGAQMLKDPVLEALYVAERHGELQRLAGQRLATQPDDAQAVLGLALAALGRDDAAARQDALQRAEGCALRQPQAAPCQYALGVVLGVQAMSEGMFKAARSAGTVHKALVAAHGLEPGWFAARSALVEFYILAPGFMGGDMDKAVDLARTAPAPEQTRALQARIAISERRFDVALQGLSALPSGLPSDLAEDVRSWSVQSSLGLINAGHADQAQAPLERLQREYPGHASPAYALGRVRAEQGAHQEALKLYGQAAGLQGADNWPIAYRMGIAYQQLGRNDAAQAALQRFVASGKGQKAALEDARKRLGQLRS